MSAADLTSHSTSTCEAPPPPIVTASGEATQQRGSLCMRRLYGCAASVGGRSVVSCGRRAMTAPGGLIDEQADRRPQRTARPTQAPRRLGADDCLGDQQGAPDRPASPNSIPTTGRSPWDSSALGRLVARKTLVREVRGFRARGRSANTGGLNRHTQQRQCNLLASKRTRLPHRSVAGRKHDNCATSSTAVGLRPLRRRPPAKCRDASRDPIEVVRDWAIVLSLLKDTECPAEERVVVDIGAGTQDMDRHQEPLDRSANYEENFAWVSGFPNAPSALEWGDLLASPSLRARRPVSVHERQRA